MTTASYLIKPASSLCTMGCAYCFYHDLAESRDRASYGIMEEETVDALLAHSLKEGLAAGVVRYCFQGGEPTLAGLPFFRAFVEKARRMQGPGQQVEYAIQTNGLALDEEWCRFLKEEDFLVGVSLDGFRENHDFFRKTRTGAGTFDEVMEAIRRLERHGVPFNILTVLTGRLAEKPQRLFRLYQKEGFRHVQLIPCLPSLDGKEAMSSHALTPEGFAHFYKGFFDCWYAALMEGEYTSVTLFDNLIPMLRGIPPQQCGMLGRCQPQEVVEGDGSVYPCDFYVLDRYRRGSLRAGDLPAPEEDRVAREFLEEAGPQFWGCGQCPYRRLCGGGCKRLRVTYFNEKFCAYQAFLRHAIPRMEAVAKLL